MERDGPIRLRAFQQARKAVEVKSKPDQETDQSPCEGENDWGQIV